MDADEQELRTTLRREANDSRPAFSDVLHGRLMTAVRAGGAPARRLPTLALAAAAAVVAVCGMAVWSLRVPPPRQQVVIEPARRPVAAQRPEAGLPLFGRYIEVDRFASLDHDASRFGRFLLDQIPRPPTIR